MTNKDRAKLEGKRESKLARDAKERKLGLRFLVARERSRALWTVVDLVIQRF